jgi:hypothetical protein
VNVVPQYALSLAEAPSLDPGRRRYEARVAVAFSIERLVVRTALPPLGRWARVLRLLLGWIALPVLVRAVDWGVASEVEDELDYPPRHWQWRTWRPAARLLARLQPPAPPLGSAVALSVRSGELELLPGPTPLAIFSELAIASGFRDVQPLAAGGVVALEVEVDCPRLQVLAFGRVP